MGTTPCKGPNEGPGEGAATKCARAVRGYPHASPSRSLAFAPFPRPLPPQVMERLNDVLVEREEIANEFKNYKKRGHLAQAAAFVEPLMQTVAEKGQETLADKGAGLFAFVTGAPGPEEEQAPAAEPEPEPAPRTPPPEPEPEIDPNDKLGVMWGFVKNAVFPPPQ